MAKFAGTVKKSPQIQKQKGDKNMTIEIRTYENSYTVIINKLYLYNAKTAKEAFKRAYSAYRALHS